MASHLMALARAGRERAAASAAASSSSAVTASSSSSSTGFAGAGAAAPAAASEAAPDGLRSRQPSAGAAAVANAFSAAVAAGENPFAAAAAAAGHGTAGPRHDLAVERMQRLSSAVAGTIFSDLINGALRPGDMGPPPASEKAIAALERNVQCEAGTSCSICLCELAAASEGSCARMPCKHVFHDSCISQWLRSHNTCPVCRAQVEADETQRPSSLASFLQGWREQQQQQRGASEGADGAHGSSARGSSSSSSDDARASGLAGLAGLADLGSQAPSVPPLPEPELLGMSVSELKRRLTELNVPFAGVVEKRELQDLLRQATRARSGPRLHVQLHMELVQVPPGSAAGTAAAFSQLARTHGAASEGSNSTALPSAAQLLGQLGAAAPASAAAAPAPASYADAARASLASRRAEPAASTSTTPVTAPNGADQPRNGGRRRRREHTPGEYSESKKSARRS